jgi:hypothetical protein
MTARASMIGIQNPVDFDFDMVMATFRLFKN